MPQTRFVLRKSLGMNKKVIVVVNKIDRPAARCGQQSACCKLLAFSFVPGEGRFTQMRLSDSASARLGMPMSSADEQAAGLIAVPEG